MKKLIIIGSGGHAKVVIDILKDIREYQIEGCISKDNIKEILGIPILGSDELLPKLIAKGIKNVFIAVGDNKRRLELSREIKKLGFRLVNVISKKATISKSVHFGSGIVVMPGAVINVETTIEDLAIINTSASVDHDCILSEACHIAPGVNLAGNVKVGRGTFLGTGAAVIPSIEIGEWSIVGAGGVVVKDIPPFSVAVGNPAKVIKKITKK